MSHREATATSAMVSVTRFEGACADIALRNARVRNAARDKQRRLHRGRVAARVSAGT
jgi:hypothetical protein